MRPTTAQGPRYGVVVSAAFHGAIFAAMLLTLRHNFDSPQDSHVVPVDLVSIADQTNVAATAPPTPPLQKLDIPLPTAEPPPEPQMQEAEPAPVPPMPKFDIAKPKPATADKPVASKKQAQDDFASLLNKLTTPDRPVKNAKAGPRAIQAAGLGNAMTADIVDALRSQIRRCWSLQIFPPNPDDAIVDYTLKLNPDGTVGGLQLQTLDGNSYARAAAEAASRAIYQCQPYHLPADRYGVWREISPLRFDPRQMMEQ